MASLSSPALSPIYGELALLTLLGGPGYFSSLILTNFKEKRFFLFWVICLVLRMEAASVFLYPNQTGMYVSSNFTVFFTGLENINRLFLSVRSSAQLVRAELSGVKGTD